MLTTYDLVWMAAERAPDHPAIVDDRTDRTSDFTCQFMISLVSGFTESAANLYRRMFVIRPQLVEYLRLTISLFLPNGSGHLEAT